MVRTPLPLQCGNMPIGGKSIVAVACGPSRKQQGSPRFFLLTHATFDKKRHCVTVITTSCRAVWTGENTTAERCRAWGRATAVPKRWPIFFQDGRAQGERAINPRLNDPTFWSSRADEVRAITEQLEDQARKELM